MKHEGYFFDEKEVLLWSEHFFVVYDSYPVSPGHCLVVARNYNVRNYFELSNNEQHELCDVLLKTKEYLDTKYNPDGYNLGTNVERAAGQTVFRFHYHVVPRYVGDTPDPRGGVRHCVPGRGYY